MRKLHISAGLSDRQINELLPRAQGDIDSVAATVAGLISEVQRDGEAALRRHAQRFDSVSGHNLPVSSGDIDAATMPADLQAAVELAIDRVRKVSLANMPVSRSVEVAAGAVVATRYVSVDSVGVYVPGGKAVYPSSVVMNVVPAQVAGVKRIALASPAQSDGLPHPTILATARLLGIDEVYAIGGASAVAAFAHGVPEIGLDPVRMVTGPGNIFVATAKSQLRGLIGIDSEAGPTEVLVLADRSANPKFVAADLISQAEHDEEAAVVLVTDSEPLAEEVIFEVRRQAPRTANRQRVEAALQGVQSAVVVTPDWSTAIAVANAYATEHLEIHSQDPRLDLSRISNAGAIFLGHYSPVSLGDYLAGSNHVLPTGQQAKFGPGLGVHTFLRPQQVIEYSQAALEEVAAALQVFSAAERLPAHGDAARIRFEER